ncbi:MAG: hypothetical protein KBF73_01810, partial [Flavobacteriales bacterium]|nr:hypothetical protein [Flavobacteriales bacterium]
MDHNGQRIEFARWFTLVANAVVHACHTLVGFASAMFLLALLSVFFACSVVVFASALGHFPK